MERGVQVVSYLAVSFKIEVETNLKPNEIGL